MAIDDFSETGGINIKELHLADPKPRESAFDPRNDVTEEDWALVRETLDNVVRRFKTENIYADDFLFLRSAAIVAPDEVRSKIDGEFWEIMKVGRDKVLTQTNVIKDLKKLELSSGMKLVFPEKATNELLSAQELAELQLHFDTMQAEGNVHDVFGVAANVRLLDPSQLPNFEVKEHTWENAKQHIEFLRQRNEFSLLSDILTSIKIAFPQQSAHLGTTGEVLKDIAKWHKDELDAAESAERFSFILSRMSILTAQDIKITDDGIELIYPNADKSLSPDKPPVPEVRKF